jgi:predicted 3-demethylubiquinone-9 3-methyltransferase (glyoxalase superfamily)
MARATKVQPFLMFEGGAKEAMRFHMSLDRYGASWQLNLS